MCVNVNVKLRQFFQRKQSVFSETSTKLCEVEKTKVQMIRAIEMKCKIRKYNKRGTIVDTVIFLQFIDLQCYI
jgi:hypothetical protein